MIKGFLNTLLGAGVLPGRLEALLPGPQPFAELQMLSCTEVNIRNDGYRICRKVQVSDPLDERFMSGPLSEMTEIAAEVAKGERIVVSVDIELCLVHPLTFPQASRARTAAMLELELSRVIPFGRQDVVAAAVETPGDDKSLLQIVIRKDVFAGTITALSAAGAKPTAITVREGNTPALPVAIAPDGTPFRKAAYETGLRTALAAALILVLAGGFAIWAAMNHAQNRDSAVAVAISAASSDAAHVSEALERHKRSSQSLTTLAALRAGRTGALAAIEELSRLLPDEAHLDGMTIDGETLTADGAAAAPELLISELEASPLFENVTLAAPIFKNPGEVKSRFSIRLNLSGPPNS